MALPSFLKLFANYSVPALTISNLVSYTAYNSALSLIDLYSLELFNLLINPEESDFDLTWHRDAIPAATSPEEEETKLTIPHYGTQWNT